LTYDNMFKINTRIFYLRNNVFRKKRNCFVLVKRIQKKRDYFLCS